MKSDILAKRRRVLQGAGVGGMALLAGCSSLGSDDDAGDDTGDNENGNETDGNGEATPEELDIPEGDERSVGIIAAPDQEALQEIELQAQALQQELQEGEITEEEFQEEQQALIEEQQRITQQAVDTIVATIEDQTDITIDEQVEFGVQATGLPVQFIDLLQADSVEGLVSVELLDEPDDPEDQVP